MARLELRRSWPIRKGCRRAPQVPGALSYGFRPGRSQHDALDATCTGMMPDAVFVAGDDEQTLGGVELAPPSDEDVRALADKIARRVSALIEQRFATTDDTTNSIVDAALRAAMQTRTVSRCALREPANDEQAEATDADHDSATVSSPRRRASVDGFCIHANTHPGERRIRRCAGG